MDGPIDGGGGGGGGGVVFSGGSSNGSVSTVSKEDNLVLSSEVSSSSALNDHDDDHDDHELELGLGLSLGCGGGGPSPAKSKSALRGGQHARILTAQDFPSTVSKASSSSSITKVNTSNNNIASCGTKRSAESFSPPRSGVRSQIVGWPPVRTHRMNSMVNQGKSPMTEDGSLTTAKSKTKSVVQEKTDGRNNKDLEKDVKKSLFVKVNMDGIPIGRKVDLSAHSCYETLAQTLDDMFCRSATCIASRQDQGAVVTESTGSLRLMDSLSEFVLTYEDKEGDWMLVGDVPWEMFILSVKRLKIMKTSEANGLAPISPPRNEGGRIKPI